MQKTRGNLWVLAAIPAAAGLVTGCTSGPAPEPGQEESGAGKADSFGGIPGQAEELRELAASHGVEPIPAAPRVSDELYELGRALSFDKILSGNKNISCMTCHHPVLATGDDRALPLGEGGTGLGAGRTGGHTVPRNAPALFNLHALETQFWDSRVSEQPGGELTTPAGEAITPAMAETCELGAAAAQAMFPVTSNHEMLGDPGENALADAGSLTGIWTGLMDRLGEIPAYVDMFETAYPGTDFEDMTFAHAANAIAGFEIRAFEATGSPWQQFLRGDDYALTNAAMRGAFQFFEQGCADCHSGPMLTDQKHHNTGLPQFGPGKGDGPHEQDDFGRERVTGDPADRYKFRTPTLHNVALTAPYGHDGQFADLGGIVAHYDDPVASLERYDITEHVAEPALWDLQIDNSADVLARLDPLTQVDVDVVYFTVAFLHSLTDPASRELTGLIPDSVPSGLPVAD